jgi:ParB/RepB/Spo0J family partition protein
MTALHHLPRTLLEPSATNPRKHFDAERQAELRASIEQHGVLQPLIVRPIAGRDGSDGQPLYEIISGERRWRASEGTVVADALPCNVGEYDDLQVLEIQLIENVQRADLHPLEEAEGYGRLVQAPNNRKVDDVAAAVGMSRRHVQARLRLLSLTPAARRAFFDGAFGVTSALQIARLNTMHQEEIVTAIAHDAERGAAWSAETITHQVQSRYMLRLAGAPFDLRDAELVPAAGACSACPKRSGSSPELFDDIAEGDTCADKACYGTKLQAHSERLLADARAAGYTLIEGAEAARLLPAPDGTVKGYLRLDRPSEFALSHKPLLEVLGPDALREVAVIVRDVGGACPLLVTVMPTHLVRQALKDKGLLRADETKEPTRETKAKKTATKVQPAAATPAAGETPGPAPVTIDDPVLAEALDEITVFGPYGTKRGKSIVVPDARVQKERSERAFTEVRRLMLVHRIGQALKAPDEEGFPSEGLSHLVARSLEYAVAPKAVLRLGAMVGIDAAALQPQKYGAPSPLWKLSEDQAARLAILMLAAQDDFNDGDREPASVVAECLGLAADDIDQRARDLVALRMATELAKLQRAAAKPKAKAIAAKSASGKAKRPGGNAKPPAFKYRNAATGETWSGRGLRPKWLKAAIAGGRTLAEFDIANAAASAPPPAPKVQLSAEAAWPFPTGGTPNDGKLNALHLARARNHLISGGRSTDNAVAAALHIDQPQARKVIEQLERDGVVGPKASDGSRAVLVSEATQ